ncbi:acyl-CoA dehydrogenase family protein [Streptomyces sp. NPDC057253]|uniref:acyl-CoA dehydrogenase family protein n=1 Tax=Streptomyces sp. NPDC057253 TaxID=3346069 RepID=UPI00362CEEC1
MDLLPSADQADIVTSLAELLREQAPLDFVREYAAPGDLAALWARLTGMGVFGLGIDPDNGGIGLGLAEEVLAFRELGRALTPGPLLGTVLAAHLAEEAGDNALTERIAGGAARVALAEAYDDPAATAGGVVSGTFRVTDLTGADLVLAVTPDGAAIIDAAGVEVTSLPSMDPTTEIGVGVIDSETALRSSASDRTWWRGCALTAALSTGIAEATLGQSVEYAKLREQFGRPIGTFQAVKHRCADMAVRAESAYFQTVFAALAWNSGDPNGTHHLASARIVSTDASRHNSADNIQNHGAMGFSQEVDAHLFAQRSLVLETTLGGERRHLEYIGSAVRVDW